MNDIDRIEMEVLEENFRLKDVGKNIKKGIKNVGKAIKEKVENIGETIKEPEYIPLTPFKPIMQATLKKRGFDNKGSLPEVTRRFFEKIVRPKTYEENVEPMTTAAIVKAVIAFIQNVLNKKESGEQLTEEEDSLAKNVLNVAGDVLSDPDAFFSEGKIKKELSATPKSAPSGGSGASVQQKSASATLGLELSPVTLLIIAAVLYFALKGK